MSGGNRKVVRALGAALAIDRVIDRSIDEKIQRLILILFIFTSCCITMRLRFSLLHVRVIRASHQARFRAARRENHLVVRGIVDRRALGTDDGGRR